MNIRENLEGRMDFSSFCRRRMKELQISMRDPAHEMHVCVWQWGLTALEIAERGFSSQPTSSPWKMVRSPENVIKHTKSVEPDRHEDGL